MSQRTSLAKRLRLWLRPGLLRQRTREKFYTSPLVGRAIARQFHKAYYYSRQRTWKDTRWAGVALAKCPLDLWVYQELIDRLRPELVIECGTNRGGSALFFANLFDLVDRGRVITVDIEPREGLRRHPRIEYLTGSSIDRRIVEAAKSAAATVESVLVVLDSDHSRDHVLEEMRLYGELVTPGSYLIVEDTNVNGHPVRPEHGPGPMEAVELFLRERSDFEIDRSLEKYYLTFNPSGYLRRRSGEN